MIVCQSLYVDISCGHRIKDKLATGKSCMYNLGPLLTCITKHYISYDEPIPGNLSSAAHTLVCIPGTKLVHAGTVTILFHIFELTTNAYVW